MQSEERNLLEPKTIQEAFRQASSFLRQAGINSANFEAEYLLRRLLELDRTQFFVQFPTPFPKELIEKYNEWLKRRQNHEPLQYIVGDQEFFGRSFQVTPAVLIPRPETEILVESVLQEAEKWCGKKELHVVDVGTGSGCISITIAKERPKWLVTAVDISQEALKVAKENAQRLQAENITFLHGSYLEPVLDVFDVFISNPPYISFAEMEELEKQVREYEPNLALAGGEDGLEPYRELVKQLKTKQFPRRMLIALEIGAQQGEAVSRLVKQLPGWVRSEIRPDLAGRDRVVLAWIEKGYQSE